MSTRNRSGWFSVVLVLSMLGASPAFAGEAHADDSSRNSLLMVTTVQVEEMTEGRVIYTSMVVEPVSNVETSASAFSGINLLDVAERSNVITAASTCYAARIRWTLYNSLGVAMDSWYDIQWCASGTTVISVPVLACDQVAANGWQEDGPCTVRLTTTTGYSYVGVAGKWKYKSGCCGVYVYSTVTVDAKHYYDGRATGTWRKT